MNFVSSALGSIGKELDNGKQTCKALFPTDAIMSAMLAAAPAGILTVMLLFSPQLYSETGLACAARMTSSNSTGHCSAMCKVGEDYRLADYYYIKSYCFGTMEDWDTDERTGEILDDQTPVSLVRFKLYPYVLFGCAVVGSLGKILWTVTVTELAAQTQYVIDGVEEAVGELIVGVKSTTVFKEALEGPSKDKDKLETIKEDPTGVNGKYIQMPKDLETEEDSNNNSNVKDLPISQYAPPRNSARRASELRKNAGRDSFDYSKFVLATSGVHREMWKEIQEYWRENRVYEKFTQLRSVMDQRTKSKKFVRIVILNRLAHFLICLFCAFSMFYIYVVDLIARDGRDLSYTYNCRLPKTFHVMTEEGYLLQTTHCIFTSGASRQILTIILFSIYIFMASAEVFWTVHNIHAWKNCFRLVRFLPFENIDDFVSGKKVTDLHLIMALVKVNEGSRDTIYCAMKTLAILGEERGDIDSFLPVFSEVLVWSATEEEGVDDLVSKVVKPADGK